MDEHVHNRRSVLAQLATVVGLAAGIGTTAAVAAPSVASASDDLIRFRLACVVSEAAERAMTAAYDAWVRVNAPLFTSYEDLLSGALRPAGKYIPWIEQPEFQRFKEAHDAMCRLCECDPADAEGRERNRTENERCRLAHVITSRKPRTPGDLAETAEVLRYQWDWQAGQYGPQFTDIGCEHDIEALLVGIEFLAAGGARG